MTRPFFDSNILVYAFGDEQKSEHAKALLRAGGRISVQSLNEFANVARKRLCFDWPEIDKSIAAILVLTGAPVMLDLDLHHNGRRLAERYTLSVYDGMIVAAALSAGCDILLSEDMQHGLLIDARLRIVNPFLG